MLEYHPSLCKACGLKVDVKADTKAGTNVEIDFNRTSGHTSPLQCVSYSQEWTAASYYGIGGTSRVIPLAEVLQPHNLYMFLHGAACYHPTQRTSKSLWPRIAPLSACRFAPCLCCNWGPFQWGYVHTWGHARALITPFIKLQQTCNTGDEGLVPICWGTCFLGTSFKARLLGCPGM